MVVDMGKVKQYIKPKAHSTLMNMRKKDLADYIRCLEHNYNVAVSFNENQAKYIESLDCVTVVRCKNCKHHEFEETELGAKYIYCCLTDECMEADDFCSRGERKNDGLSV